MYTTTAASWYVVMTLKGELVQVAPAVYPAAPSEFTHACALKNYDEAHLLVAPTVAGRSSGLAYKWDWRNDTYAPIGGNRTEWGCHDIQWSALHADSFWVPNSAAAQCHDGRNANVSRVNATSGAVLETVASGYSECRSDVNHAQLVEDDAAVLFSLREMSALAKYYVNGTRAWTIGGFEGEWPIRDFDRAVVYPPGASVWFYQHNAEFMSPDEIWMFDNSGLGNQSRLLIVRVNETAKEAQLEWEYRLGKHSQIYGDCDPTPAGNVLGSWWDVTFGNASADAQAQSGVVEVVRATKEVAWKLDIVGRACPTSTCHSSHAADLDAAHPDRSQVWLMYSVERFYDAPVLPSPGSDFGAPACAGGSLVFVVFDSFKASSMRPGTFALTEHRTGLVAMTGTFEFEPHWRPTSISRHIDANVDGLLVQLEVKNSRGRAARFAFTCDSSR